MKTNYTNKREIETNGLYTKNFGTAPYPFERHHIVPYKTCMANGDVELACDAMNNSVDLPKSIHIELHKFLADNGYSKTVAFSETEYGNIRELTYEFLLKYTELLDDYYNPNIPMDIVIRKYNDSIGDGKCDVWNRSDEIVDMYVNQNMSTYILADAFNCDASTISKILKSKSIEMHDLKSGAWKYVGEIIDKYVNNNMTTRQIADEYDCSKTTICEILKSNGIELRNGKSDVWNHADEIIAKYKSGMSTIKLGDEYCVTKKTIRDILKSNGVELRKSGGSHLKSGAWNHVDEIVSDYESEMTQKSLARKYGVSRSTIYAILKSAGAI